MAVLSGAKYVESNKGTFQIYGATTPTTQNTMPDGSTIPRGSIYYFNDGTNTGTYQLGATAWGEISNAANALPVQTAGDIGKVLTTDGAGTLYWSAPSGGYTSYVEAANFAALPANPAQNVLYLTQDDNKLYALPKDGSIRADLEEVSASTVSISGAYTPTFTPGVNITSAANIKAVYNRQGNYVMVTIALNITTSSSGRAEFTFPVPFVSSIVSTSGGGVISGAHAAVHQLSGYCYTSAGVCYAAITSPTNTLYNSGISFSYLLS